MSLRDWVTLCAAAGLSVRRLSPMEVFQLSGKLIDDPVLTLKARELDPNNDQLPGGSRIAALMKMSPEELALLRERVTGVVPIKPERAQERSDAVDQENVS